MNRMSTSFGDVMRAFFALGLVACLLGALSGCELVADFDRSKIPMPIKPSVDAGRDDEDSGQAPDDAGQDAGLDAAALPDASGEDDAGNSGDDAGQDEDAG